MNSELMDRELSNTRDGIYRAIPRAPGILIADDIGLLLTMLKLELELLGFSVWLAVDGDGAIDVYRQHRDKIDLVLLNVQMPGLDGTRTLAALRSINPEIHACFMTGGSDRYTEEDLLACGAACVVGKPFRAAEIAHLLQQIGTPPLSQLRRTHLYREGEEPMHVPRRLGLSQAIAEFARRDTNLHSVEGTIQRIDYLKRELTLIAEGRAWHFALCGDSQFWFNGRRAPFRCFQPLDHARIVYKSLESKLIAQDLFVSAEEAAGSQ